MKLALYWYPIFWHLSIIGVQSVHCVFAAWFGKTDPTLSHFISVLSEQWHQKAKKSQCRVFRRKN